MSVVGSEWPYLIHFGEILNRLFLNLFLFGPHAKVMPIVRRASPLLLCELGEKNLSNERKSWGPVAGSEWVSVLLARGYLGPCTKHPGIWGGGVGKNTPEHPMSPLSSYAKVRPELMKRGAPTCVPQDGEGGTTWRLAGEGGRLDTQRGPVRKQVPQKKVAVGGRGWAAARDSGLGLIRVASACGEDGPAPGPRDLHQHCKQRPTCTSSFFWAVFVSTSLLLFLP